MRGQGKLKLLDPKQSGKNSYILFINKSTRGGGGRGYTKERKKFSGGEALLFQLVLLYYVGSNKLVFKTKWYRL